MIKPRIILEKIKPYFNTPQAIIITGMRRTGKTTLLNLIYTQIDSHNKIFLDLENPINRKYFEVENYEKIKKNFQLLGIDFSKKAFVFCDEIQFVKNLPSVVKYFYDHYQIKFFLTGSANFYLKNLFSESLSGRKFIFELYPLTFSEFLLFKEINLKIPKDPKEITRSIFDTILPFYEEYILFGGFPQVVLENDIARKKKILEEIFTSFFQLEIRQLGDFKKNEVVRDLMLLLMQRAGSKLDIQKLSKELKVSRPTLTEYIYFLESTYFIKTIKPFSRNKDIEIRKMPKVYICDSGLINHFAKVDMGVLFENSIFQNLQQKGELNYYQRKSGVEIDFILNKEEAYEVKINADESDLRRLKDLCKDLNIKKFKIISKNYSDLENVVYGFNI
ncbi:MAG: ATP-binding protein [Candidatus Omnitrophica bacterium]|nr:ATP-binding protein [Candidatus Omnitrophota bacterium]MCM8832255.1 ATP-binding protein [Candidatus Omnitrophota bacterium]